MSVTQEELAAFADGELDPARAAEIAAAVAADPALEAQVRAHQGLKKQLGAHFAPIAADPVPERLSGLLEPKAAEVVDFAEARAGRERSRTLPRWTWFAAPVLAASLALAVFLPRGGNGDYAQGTLAETLDGQLVAEQDPASATRILLSFRDADGDYCRAFASEAQSGIACRDDTGWRLAFEGGGAAAQGADYRMAGAGPVEVLERVQVMAAGPALDAREEAAARARGWR